MTREQAFRKLATIASLGPQEVVTVHPKEKPSSLKRLRQRWAGRPALSERTELLLKKYGLHDRYEQTPNDVIEWLVQLAQGRPTREEIYALAEIAIVEADWMQQQGESTEAANLYAIAMIHSCRYLFDEKLDLTQNVFDPQFRGICDFYNRALESLLRQACASKSLVPGQTVQLGDQENGLRLEVNVVGRWADQEFEHFELVSDYRTEGLENHYHTYGLGVPLIAIRKQQSVHSPAEEFYPPELTLPMTAFCEFLESSDESEGTPHRAVVTLYDPLERTSVKVGGHLIPLESDITTPLAYHLRDPLLHSGVLETASLLNAELAPELYGMYMLEPFDPDKIPVVMVHGFWSGPVTWAPMFNDLRANREIRDNYQFWFYSYPSGQPFWLSARQMRKDLENVRLQLDPERKSKSLDQMILVGHSMGGLVATMQTLESGDLFWEMISDEPISKVSADPDAIGFLREIFFFSPNPSIRRVITIATPFQGSLFANRATRWISKKIFTLPQAETSILKQAAKSISTTVRGKRLLSTATSLDSLAPNAPVFEAIRNATRADGVTYHNIYGHIAKQSWLGNKKEKFHGDGVVSLKSAHCPWASSELAVPAEHSDVHQNAHAIYEVKRILLENLTELERIPIRKIPRLP